MAVRDRVGRASLHAVATKDAPRIVDVVHTGVALACRNALRIRVLRSFYVNAIRRARRGAKEAAYAFFQSTFVAVQYVNAAIPRLEVHRLVRIIFRHGLSKHVPKRDAKALRERAERFRYFPDDGRHARKSNKHPIRAANSDRQSDC